MGPAAIRSPRDWTLDRELTYIFSRETKPRCFGLQSGGSGLSNGWIRCRLEGLRLLTFAQTAMICFGLTYTNLVR